MKNKEKILSNRLKQQKGITLIALVVTIVVLIILAVVSINVIFGENGLITSAERGEIEHTHATVWERMEMSYSDYWAGKVAGEETSLIDYLQKADIIAKTETNGGYKINVEILTGTRLALGNGTGEQDVYKLEPTKIEGASTTKLASKKDTIKLAETDEEKTYKVMYYGKEASKNRELGILIDGEKPTGASVKVSKEIVSKKSSPYKLGETIKYKITIENIGKVKIESFKIEDVISAGSGNIKKEFTAFTNPADQTYLEVGQKGYIEYEYTVVAGDIGSTISNAATLVETVPLVPKGERVPVIEEVETEEGETKLELTKEIISSSREFYYGDWVDFRITVKNTGTTRINSFKIKDVVNERVDRRRIYSIYKSSRTNIFGSRRNRIYRI